MNAKKIIIMGVGRSGTTGLYATIQKILEAEVGGNIDFVYEPFLWDRETYNRRHEEITTEEWSKASAISIEGIYCHKKMDLFVSNDDLLDDTERAFMSKTFTASAGKSHILCKVIRGNGRLDLIRKLHPDAKIIFIMRNPVDVINSSINLFSFFMDDFTVSDYPRFIEEIKKKKYLDFTKLPVENVVEKEYSYWFAMNLEFLKSYQKNKSNIFPIIFENYVRNREVVLNGICDFIGVGFKPEYLQLSMSKVGPINSKSVNLKKADFEFLLEKLSSYEEFSKMLEAPLPTNILNAIKAKYPLNFYEGDYRSPSNGRHSLYLRKQLDEQREKNSRLEKSMDKVNQRILQLRQTLDL